MSEEKRYQFLIKESALKCGGWFVERHVEDEGNVVDLLLWMEKEGIESTKKD